MGDGEKQFDRTLDRTICTICYFSCPGSPVWTRWVKICAAINKFFSKIFYKWAGIAGTYPKVVIFTCLFISLGFSIGFLRINIQSQGERLYFEQSNTASIHLDRADNSFPAKSRPEEFIIMMKSRQSILTAKAFKAALMLHKGILQTELNEICTRYNAKDATVSGCLTMGPLELFPDGGTNMTDESIVSTLLEKIQNDQNIMQNGRPASVNLKYVLGKLELNLNGSNKTIWANALRMQYYVRLSETDDMYEVQTKVESEIIKYFESKLKELESDGIDLYFNTGRSIDDEVSNSSGGDIKFVVVSLGLMCLFTTFVLSRIKDKVAGHFWVGVTGIGCIILGIGGAFGIIMLSGEYFVTFVGTLPFLVLGVGIDDMFIIIDALDHVHPDVRGIKRLQVALGNVGASVTMTTMTDLVAFAVSSSTVFPAIRYFCIYAAVTIFFSYAMIITLMIAVMALDIKRIEAGRLDIIPCKKIKNYEPWKQSQTSFANRLMFAWGRFLMRTPVRIIVMILCFGLLGVSIYGTTKVEEKFDARQLGTDGSMYLLFQDARDENFFLGFPINIIEDSKSFDYSSALNQDIYRNLSNICYDSGYQNPSATINWMKFFLDSKYCSSKRSNCTGNKFYTSLHSFLNDNPKFRADIRVNNGSIQASRITCRDKSSSSWVWKKDAMVNLRDDIKAYNQMTHIFPITFDYFYREQILLVKSETIRNLLLCAVAILIITTPYLVHPAIILLVFFGFVALVFELFALMAIWDVALNSISMITSIMSIGFAVDYSAHIAHAYLMSNLKTPEERIIHAVGDIGASVLMGGTSTFIGIVVMAFGSSEIFRIFFRMVFGIVVLGLLNGLLFLPVLLSVFCRTNVHISNEMEDNAPESIDMHENKLKDLRPDDHGHTKYTVNDTKQQNGNQVVQVYHGQQQDQNGQFGIENQTFVRNEAPVENTNYSGWHANIDTKKSAAP